jgi:hypothetical protein
MTDHEKEIENLQLLIDALRDELTERIHMCDMRSEKILELTDERDEARRSVCEMSLQLGQVFRRIGGKNVEVTTPEGCAEIMRWDCFRDNK